MGFLRTTQISWHMSIFFSQKSEVFEKYVWFFDTYFSKITWQPFQICAQFSLEASIWGMFTLVWLSHHLRVIFGLYNPVVPIGGFGSPSLFYIKITSFWKTYVIFYLELNTSMVGLLRNYMYIKWIDNWDCCCIVAKSWRIQPARGVTRSGSITPLLFLFFFILYLLCIFGFPYLGKIVNIKLLCYWYMYLCLYLHDVVYIYCRFHLL